MVRDSIDWSTFTQGIENDVNETEMSQANFYNL